MEKSFTTFQTFWAEHEAARQREQVLDSEFADARRTVVLDRQAALKSVYNPCDFKENT